MKPVPIASLKFPVKEILEGEGLALDVQVASEDLADPTQNAYPAAPVALHIEFSIGGNSVLLQARAEGAWKTACSRCLAEHAAPFACELDETYENTAETIDLSDDVRQAVLLEFPQRSLCRPSCLGLCPRCGKNLNEGACGCGPQKATPFDSLKKLKRP